MKKLFLVLLLILLFPVLVFAQTAEPGFMDSFTAQPWYLIVSEIVTMMSFMSAGMPARWKNKKDGTQRTWYKWLYMVVEFLASNVFNAKTKDIGDDGVKSS